VLTHAVEWRLRVCRRAVAGTTDVVDRLAIAILFRADIHKLFDAGYVTVTPDYHFQVSRRIKEEFENGRDYYALNGSSIRLPKVPADHPLVESLYWHNEERYLG
jgi:putative restriction endonuclease